VSRSGAAAAADEFRTGLDETLSERRHVLRRTHIELAALNITRESGVRLCGEVLCRHLAHQFERGEHVVRAHSAIQADNVDPELIEGGRERFRRSTERRFAIHLNGHLGDDRQVRNFAHCADRLLDNREFRKRFENEKIYAAFGKRLGLLLK
jgi:hypothetical protein